MRQGLRVAVVLGAMVGLPGMAAAQVGSHCLPPDMTPALFPSWVLRVPEFETQELNAPLLREAMPPRRRPAAAPGEGLPDATALANMCKEPREAIRLAEDGKYPEAIKAGEPVLQSPRDRFGDYTWDYLGNALAWAYLQVGNIQGATQAHNAAAARIEDLAIIRYHRVAATMLTATDKKPAELKDAAVYQAEIRRSLADDVTALKQSAALATKTRTAESRLRNLTQAYAILRAVTATDPEIGKQLADSDFREAADGFCTDVIPALLDDARQVRDRLVAATGTMIPEHHFVQWNTDVNTLWNRVAHAKRFCRLHAYLVRVHLAQSRESARQFGEAHRLLFVPSSPGLVWQEIGYTRLLNGVAQLDLRLRVPYQETPIAPLGVAPSGAGDVAAGWRKMDGKMEKMDPMTGKMEKMDPMTGKMKPMDGKMDPMTGKMRPMDGKMDPMGR